MSNKALHPESQIVSDSLLAMMGAGSGEKLSVDGDTSKVYDDLQERRGHSKEVVTSVDEGKTLFAAGVVHATGIKAMEVATADPTRNKLHAEVKGSNGDVYTAHYTHFASGNMAVKEGEAPRPWTKHGGMRLATENNLGSKGGHLGTAFSTINEAATAAATAAATSAK